RTSDLVWVSACTPTRRSPWNEWFCIWLPSHPTLDSSPFQDVVWKQVAVARLQKLNSIVNVTQIKTKDVVSNDDVGFHFAAPSHPRNQHLHFIVVQIQHDLILAKPHPRNGIVWQCYVTTQPNRKKRGSSD